MAKTQSKPTNEKTPASEETKSPEENEESVANIFGVASDDGFDFEKAEGLEVFGGSYPRLELLEGQTSVPLVYRKDTEIPLDGDPDEKGNPTTKMQTVHVVEIPSGDLVTCPISAIFMKHFKEADIQEGDTFRIKRYANAVKKRGKGAGNKMQVYAVGVTARAKAES